MAGTPPVRVDDRDSSFTTHLWNTGENVANRRARPDTTAVYGTDSDKTFLVGLEEEERIQVNGVATGIRISNESQYSNDPLTALCEWGARMLSMVNGTQGSGWDFVNDYTGRSLPGVIESVTLVRRRGAKYEVEWSITFRVGEGMMSHEKPNPPAVSPTSSPTIDGQDLYEIESMSIDKSEKVDVTKIALADPVDNIAMSMSGAKKQFTLRGKVPGQESVRTNFDQTFRDAAGSDTIVEFVTPFPGTTIDVMVADFESTRESGTTQIGEYNLQVVEGVTS